MSLTKAAMVIVEERTTNGNYKNMEDFIKRVPGRIVNSKALKNLLVTGAFADFGDLEEVRQQIELVKGVPIECDMSKSALMKTEFELLGTNVTYIDPLLKKAKEYANFNELEDGSSKMMIKISKTVVKKTKTGKDYLFHSAEDMNSGTSFSLFNWNKKELEVGRAIIVNITKKGDFISLTQEFKRQW